MFKINTMGNYHYIYLKTDVLLLAYVFENFINIYSNYYGLDPCRYFSSPRLSLGAMLKMTEIELELINDIDMHLFIEKGVRGGISYISKDLVTQTIKHYDSGKENKYMMYLDANNLHGYAMSQYLPYCRFKWLNKKGIDRFYVNSIGGNSSVVHILKDDQIIVVTLQMNMKQKLVELISQFDI